MYQILHAKWVITCETNNRILENYALVIKDGRIENLLPSSAAKANYADANATHADYPSHILMPGFINCHTHLAMNVFRGLADDLALSDWLNHHIWPAEGKWVSEEMVYEGSQLAIAELIRSGSVCFNDMYFFPGATAKAAKEAGIRAHIGMTIISVPTKWAKNTEEYFTKADEFYHEYHNEKLITPTLAPHSLYTVDIKDIVRVKQLAERYKLKINIHLQEDASEVKNSLATHKTRPLQRLYDAGIVDNHLIAIHMTQVDEKDLQILSEKKPNIVHCPESNMKLASRNCPVEKLLTLGLNVALGTDGAASNNDLDMIGEMRSAAFLGKITANDPKAVNAESVIKMATIHGAKALGIDHMTGSLEVGKSADCIAIDMESLETQPLYHALSQVVYAAARNQVTDVWVAGKQLLKGRQLQTLDELALLKKAKTWRERIKSFD